VWLVRPRRSVGRDGGKEERLEDGEGEGTERVEGTVQYTVRCKPHPTYLSTLKIYASRVVY